MTAAECICKHWMQLAYADASHQQMLDDCIVAAEKQAGRFEITKGGYRIKFADRSVVYLSAYHCKEVKR